MQENNEETYRDDPHDALRLKVQFLFQFHEVQRLRRKKKSPKPLHEAIYKKLIEFGINEFRETGIPRKWLQDINIPIDETDKKSALKRQAIRAGLAEALGFDVSLFQLHYREFMERIEEHFAGEVGVSSHQNALENAWLCGTYLYIRPSLGNDAINDPHLNASLITIDRRNAQIPLSVERYHNGGYRHHGKCVITEKNIFLSYTGYFEELFIEHSHAIMNLADVKAMSGYDFSTYVHLFGIELGVSEHSFARSIPVVMVNINGRNHSQHNPVILPFYEKYLQGNIHDHNPIKVDINHFPDSINYYFRRFNPMITGYDLGPDPRKIKVRKKI